MMEPRSGEQPTPGWYRVRLTKGGPWLGARVMHADGLWLALINGQPTGPAEADPWRCNSMERVALYGRAITEGEYAALLAAAAEAPAGHPLSDPAAPVDFRRAPSLF